MLNAKIVKWLGAGVLSIGLLTCPAFAAKPAATKVQPKKPAPAHVQKVSTTGKKSAKHHSKHHRTSSKSIKQTSHKHSKSTKAVATKSSAKSKPQPAAKKSKHA
jgi:hypothetical protein